jgi:hypothetical protein
MSPLKAACSLALAAALSLAAVPAHAADDDDLDLWTGLTETYEATGTYPYEPLATTAGYVRSDVCASDAKLGGAGYHYVNPAYVGSLDPETPAALLYEDGEDGERNLVAVEWIVNDADQNPLTDGDRPTLFGQRFEEPAQYPGEPLRYRLHAWIYKSNSSGMFAPWNPTVTCPAT